MERKKKNAIGEEVPYRKAEIHEKLKEKQARAIAREQEKLERLKEVKET